MAALVSEATPINMVQHNYFNLLGQGDVLDHNFRILGETYTPLSPALIPTGEIVPVGGTPFDFRSGRTLRDSDGTPRAYDINLGLGVKDPEKNPAAVVTAPDRSLTLRLWSAQPGLQLYTGAYLNSLDAGLGDIHYKQYGGFCLEDQMFPDALNHPNFPSIVVSPEKPYTHWCEIEIN
jgi:aldose 1-epimerase